MYFVKYGKDYLHDPRQKEYMLLDLSLSGKENSCGFCDFTIYPNHPMYNKLKEHDASSPIKVYDDDELLFSGFIYELGKEFQLDGHVKCKGDLAYLCESIVRPYSTLKRGYGQQAPTNPAEYFAWLIRQHNAQVDVHKQFTIGINQALLMDSNAYIYRENDSYPNTFDEISDKLLKNTGFGGVLRVRYEGDVRYIDYLVEWTSSNTTQTLEFGKNLTDYSQTDDSEEIYTAVVAIGAKMNETKYNYNDGYFVTSDTTPVSGKEYFTKDSEPHKYHTCTNLTAFEPEKTYYEYDEEKDASNANLTLTELADGTYDGVEYIKVGDKVYSEVAVAKYGWIIGTYKNTDITERENLVKKAITYLKTVISPKRTIEIKAVDMHLINPDIKPIRIGEYIRVKSKPHDLDSYFLCAEIDLDLNNPQNSIYTLGMTYDTLTGQQNKQILKLNATINDKVEAVEQLTEEVKMDAKHAAQTAEEAKNNVTNITVKVESAVEKAEEAINKTEKTEETIDKINQSVSDAESAAKDAVTNAQSAIEASAAAQAAADAVAGQMVTVNDKITAAENAANNANELANSANEAATAAGTSAENAVITANAAKAEAEKAKEDIANLGSSLETLEQTMTTDYAKKTDLTEVEATLSTSISQNAAAIESHASQITTISTDVNTAKDDAAIAKSTAEDAASAAAAAQVAADDAASKVAEAEAAASAAQSIADEAKTAAATAQSKAEEAEQDLATAKSNLEALQQQADATDEDLARAQAAVETAQTAADAAQLAASNASSAAEAAQATANNAKEAADGVKATADSAKEIADAAQTKAEEAKEAAEAAQAAADSLGTRMATAETAIQQNAEEIALKASKEEVNKANNEIRDSLKNYASIDVVATQISSVVEETKTNSDEITNLKTLVQHNAESIKIKVNEERVDALGEDLANTSSRVENIEKYVVIDSNGVTIGEKSYPYVARITQSAFQIGTFIDGVFVPVSYLNEDTLSNRNVEVSNALTIGKTKSDTDGYYQWNQELDGTLSLIFKA